MEQVPDIISTKDLDYLCDIFNWNYNTSKVAHHFEEETNNNDLKEVYHDVYEIHLGICEDILRIIGGTYEQD